LVLDDGEASCLAVAFVRKGVLFSDDRDARRYAQRLGISFSGTVGILILLVKEGHLILDQADLLLQAMIRTGYYSPVGSLKDIYP
jgi:predicted nucleic acid-binding protein